MKRLRAWLVRRLTQPELGEVRRFGGADFTLEMIDHHLEVFDTHTVVLTYVKPYLTQRGIHEQGANYRTRRRDPSPGQAA